MNVTESSVSPGEVLRKGAVTMGLLGSRNAALEAESRALLKMLLFVSATVTVLTTLVGSISSGQWSRTPMMLTPALFQLACVGLMRVLPARVVAIGYLLLVTFFFFLGARFDSGTRGQAYYGLILVVFSGSLILGSRWSAVFFLAALAIGLTLAWIETTGRLPAPAPRGPWEALLVPVSAFLMTALITSIVASRRARILVRLETLNEQLSGEVDRRRVVESELQNAYARALEASTVKSSFLANVSHELRTPMNAVVGLTDVLLCEAQPHQREHLELIRASSEGLLTLLNELLDFSKIEAGAMRFEPTAWDVRKVVREAAKLYEPRALAKGLRFEVTIDAAVPAHVESDSFRFRQVLGNLLSNAVKFTETGSVRATVTRDGNLMVLHVTDTGIGVSKADEARLFQPFTQADASTTRRFGGTGLGLSIVRRLVELQGGTVVFDSEEGRGTTVAVRLPAPDAVAPVEAPHVETGPAIAGLRVLLVEDNVINQRVARALLDRLETKPAVASNGFEAIERVKSETFDVVLMDLQMPELDGLEATRRIRAEVAQPPPIVALTANAQREDEEAARAAGASDFLSKPVRLEQLRHALERVRSRPSSK